MRQGINTIGHVAVLAVAMLVLAVPAQALAQQVTQEGYSPSSVDDVGSGYFESGSVEGASQKVAGDPTGGGSLPFTGFDAVLIAVAGVSLVGLGFGLRFVTRPETA